MINKHNKSIKKAVALSYESDDLAPKVIAKGTGLVADNIITHGMENDITIYEDKELIDSLMSVDIMEHIPEELYEAVAEILIYIYSLDAKRGKEYGK